MEFVAVYGVDMKESTLKSPKLADDFKEYFWNSLESNEHYQNATKVGRITAQRYDDGTFIVTKIRHLPDLMNLSKYMWMVVQDFNEKHNLSEKFLIRQGIHVGECRITYRDEEISNASGNGIEYCERVMRLGDGTQILLTASAHATISTITNEYDKYLDNIGIYPIKHGRRIIVYNFHWESKNDRKEVFGNARRPNKNKSSLIFDISKKNQALAITLIGIAIVSVVFGGFAFAEFYGDITLSDVEKSEISERLEQKIRNLIDIHQKAEIEIQKEFATTIHNKNQEIDITLEQRNNINAFLKAMAFHPEIEYMLIANSNPHCSVLLYEPYWHSFDPNRDLSQLDRCQGMEKYTVYLSTAYFATGPGMFVNSLVTGIYNDLPEYRPPIAHLVMGINWAELVKETPSFTSLDNTRMMLVDHQGFVTFDCTGSSCAKFDANHESKKPVSFEDALTENYDYDIISFNGIDVPQENEHIMKDWNLYVMHPKTDVISLGLLQLSVLIIPVIMLGILVYYYLAPRNWLDEM